MYLRFVVGPDNADHRQLVGVSTEARLLRDNGELHDYEDAWLQENNGTASEAINLIWEFVNLLTETGKNVRVLKSKNPGYVWYEDNSK